MSKKTYIICNSADDSTFTERELTKKEFLLIEEICNELDANAPLYCPTLSISEKK